MPPLRASLKVMEINLRQLSFLSFKNRCHTLLLLVLQMHSSGLLPWIEKKMSYLLMVRGRSLMLTPPGTSFPPNRFSSSSTMSTVMSPAIEHVWLHGVSYSARAWIWRHILTSGPIQHLRVIQALAARYGLFKRHLDCSKAFTQADLDTPCYMKPPPGMKLPKGKCLKLHKSVYGLKQASRLFNQLIWFLSLLWLVQVTLVFSISFVVLTPSSWITCCYVPLLSVLLK